MVTWENVLQHASHVCTRVAYEKITRWPWSLVIWYTMFCVHSLRLKSYKYKLYNIIYESMRYDYNKDDNKSNKWYNTICQHTVNLNAPLHHSVIPFGCVSLGYSYSSSTTASTTTHVFHLFRLLLITQDYPGRTTQDYPGLPRTTQELVIPVALSIGDSCTKHYILKCLFEPVMISIMDR